MKTMKEIDKSINKTETEQRRKFLIMNLHHLDVYQNDAGIPLEHLRLAELEWLYIEEKNKMARAYGEEI